MLVATGDITQEANRITDVITIGATIFLHAVYTIYLQWLVPNKK